VTDSDLDPELSDEDRLVAAELARERGVPPAAFRGSLRRQMIASDPGYGPRPERLRPIAGALIALGCVTIGLGALQAIGAL